jgi:hypothetical protein
MATRGQIAFLNKEGNTINTIYNHYDSYPEALGKALNEYYNSYEEAEDLVMNNKNGIRFIDPESGMVDQFTDGKPMTKQITDLEPESLFERLYDYADSAMANYVYVWIKNKWVTCKMSNGRDNFIETLLNNYPSSETTNINENKNMENHVIGLLNKLESKFKTNPGFQQYKESVMRDIEAGGDRLSGYMDFNIDDMEEDYRNYSMDKMDIDESFVKKMKFRAGIIK